MEINRAMAQNIGRIRYALGIEAIKKSLSQDARSMNALLHGFRTTNAKIAENSVTPHKGGTIDVKI